MSSWSDGMLRACVTKKAKGRGGGVILNGFRSRLVVTKGTFFERRCKMVKLVKIWLSKMVVTLTRRRGAVLCTGRGLRLVRGVKVLSLKFGKQEQCVASSRGSGHASHALFRVGLSGGVTLGHIELSVWLFTCASRVYTRVYLHRTLTTTVAAFIMQRYVVASCLPIVQHAFGSKSYSTPHYEAIF